MDVHGAIGVDRVVETALEMSGIGLDRFIVADIVVEPVARAVLLEVGYAYNLVVRDGVFAFTKDTRALDLIVLGTHDLVKLRVHVFKLVSFFAAG